MLPEAVEKLIRRAIEPAAYYGAVVWQSAAYNERRLAPLEKAMRQACLLLAGTFFILFSLAMIAVDVDRCFVKTLSPSDVTLPCSVGVSRARERCLSCQLRLETPFSGPGHELTNRSRRITSPCGYIMNSLNLISPSPNTVTSLLLLSFGAALPQ